jgi:hypothetical protein
MNTRVVDVVKFEPKSNNEYYYSLFEEFLIDEGYLFEN